MLVIVNDNEPICWDLCYCYNCGYNYQSHHEYDQWDTVLVQNGEICCNGSCFRNHKLWNSDGAAITILGNGLMGAEFGDSAFLSGAISSIVASGMQGLGGMGNFGNNNPDLLKAIMITTGGLSGGISAIIAGGKFWDGFRQGIITSGLNHVAHLTAAGIQEGQNRKQILARIAEKYGEAYLNQPITENTLQELATVFSEMYNASGKNYAFANKSNLDDNMELEYGELIHNGRVVNGITDMVTGKILFAPKFLGTKSLSTFAGTWYHETIHSIHAVSGFFKETWTKFMKNGYEYEAAMSMASDVSETIAHFQTRTYGIGLTFDSPARTIRTYGQSYLKFLNLK